MTIAVAATAMDTSRRAWLPFPSLVLPAIAIGQGAKVT
jgi:hypothetical protein